MASRLSIISGDGAAWRVTVVDAIDALVDLSVYDEMYFTIKRSTQDSDAAALWQGTLTGGGIAIVDLGHADIFVPALAYRVGRPYYWDFQLSASGSQPFTPCNGTILAEVGGNVTSA